MDAASRPAFYRAGCALLAKTPRERVGVGRGEVGVAKSEMAKQAAVIARHLQADRYVVGVPVLRSCETAVTNCAGANGLVKRMLLGTPCEAH